MTARRDAPVPFWMSAWALLNNRDTSSISGSYGACPWDRMFRIGCSSSSSTSPGSRDSSPCRPSDPLIVAGLGSPSHRGGVLAAV